VVRIVTDSTADLSKAQQQAAGITVVPLNVHFGEVVYRDQFDLDSDRFLKLLSQHAELPKTSQPASGLFEETYARLGADGSSIVSIHLSSKLSGTLHSAEIARDALRVLLLRSDRDNPRHKLRFDITSDLLDRAGIVHRTLAFPGQSMLSEVLQLAYFTDYVSFYLALLNGADPSEVRSIDYLKDQLAKG